MSFDHERWAVAQPSRKFDTVELGRLDRGSNDRLAICTAIATGEQAVFAAHADGPDRPLQRIVTQVSAAVVQEPGQRRPSPERVADGLGQA